jgi:hypothetical protein
MRLHETLARLLGPLLVVCALALAGQAAAAEDPCALLEPAEVEAVLGEPLAGPPFRASNGLPDPEGASCRYETPAYRAIDLRVEWSNGGDVFGAMNIMSGIADDGGLKGILILSDGTTLRGEWDEARVFMCCEFNALRGDQLVVIDISGSRATVEQAATLADLAVKRLDQPLDVDGTAGLAAAAERIASRPAIVSACDLVPRTEAETLVGAPLLADPEGSEHACTYFWSPPGADYQEQLTLMVTWRGGLSEMRRTQSAIGQALSFMGSEGLPSDQIQESGTALFDVSATSMIGVMAVRKDVMLSVETGGMGNDLASAFISAAAKKL